MIGSFKTHVTAFLREQVSALTDKSNGPLESFPLRTTYVFLHF
jgi:hypothetical protein